MKKNVECSFGQLNGKRSSIPCLVRQKQMFKNKTASSQKQIIEQKLNNNYTDSDINFVNVSVGLILNRFCIDEYFITFNFELYGYFIRRISV